MTRLNPVRKTLSALALITALGPAADLANASELRQLGAHQHGVGELGVAVEGTTVVLAFNAPGADIVGFEHLARSEADEAKIEVAKRQLADPLALFSPSAAADCAVSAAEVALVTDADPDDHLGHDHAAHGRAAHDQNGLRPSPFAEPPADPDPNQDAGLATRDAASAGAPPLEGTHSEFEALYMLTCANPSALVTLEFAYFDAFPGAQQVEVTLVTDRGQTAAAVSRAARRFDMTAGF